VCERGRKAGEGPGRHGNGGKADKGWDGCGRFSSDSIILHFTGTSAMDFEDNDPVRDLSTLPSLPAPSSFPSLGAHSDLCEKDYHFKTSFGPYNHPNLFKVPSMCYCVPIHSQEPFSYHHTSSVIKAKS